MNGTKRFLVALALVSLVVWLAGNVLLGPPSFSGSYMEQYKQEHEHYLEVTKSHAYKLYAQRPELHPPDAPDKPPNFAASVAFVEAYMQRPEFQAEQRRIARYEIFFDFFNTGVVLVLIAWVARKPLVQYLDSRIAALETRMAEVEAARSTAAAQLAAAQAKMAGLPEEQAQVDRDTEDRIAREMEAVSLANAQSLELMERELQDRLMHEELAARQAMKRELVDRALDELAQRLQSGPQESMHERLIEEFAAEMERGPA